MLTEFDLHLFNEGTLHRAYEKLGAHQREVDGRPGVHFAVWAPNAEKVSVIGDFNGWNPASHADARASASSGIWETFVPDVGDGERYKYEIRSRATAPACRRPIRTASSSNRTPAAPPSSGISIATPGAIRRWMRGAAAQNGWLDRPMSVYELHLGFVEACPRARRRAADVS